MKSYFTYDLLIPMIIFMALMITFFVLRKNIERKALKSRFANIKGQKEQGFFAQYSSQNSNLPPFLRSLFGRLVDFNKNAVLRFKLDFEQCGWNPQAAPYLVPIIKLVGILVFIGCFVMIKDTIPQFKGLPYFVKACVFVVFIFMGFRSFDYTAGIFKRIRYKELEQTLPMVIDLLVVCTRSGLSLDKSIDRIAHEIGYLVPSMAKELAITATELAILPERRMALQNLAKRVELPLVKSLTIALVQAEEQGVSIGQTLQILSQESSKQRLLDMEAKAARLPSMLTVPMMIFSLPVLFILILGPGISKMIDSNFFSNMSKR